MHTTKDSDSLCVTVAVNTNPSRSPFVLFKHPVHSQRRERKVTWERVEGDLDRSLNSFGRAALARHNFPYLDRKI